MTSLDKLNENISAEDYQLCQRVWEDNDMKTMKEFLTWYNNKDVEPMLEAIDKMFQFNQNRHIDMFKDGISVPGLTLKYMFQDLPDYFTLPDEKNKDLYDLYKNNIVGGPSIVFHRYHEKDKTFIRPTEYTDPKPCQLIYGVDANALYLWSIMQKMPTGHFVRRKKEDGFKRQAPRRYECMAINWLEWEALQSRQSIRHQGNDSEKLIGMKRLPVDGFCRDTNTVYEFQGCIWHGHRCWMTKKHNGVNPVNGKNLDDLYQHTQDKIQYIKEQGYNVVEMGECQWLASIKRDLELSRFIEHRKRPSDGLVTMTEDQILTAVVEISCLVLWKSIFTSRIICSPICRDAPDL
jgi:G:T-mismatch repair DNA endonuclease (very short patch repair protein)